MTCFRSLLLYSQFNGRRERGSSLFGSLGLDPQKETFGIDRISGVMALDSISGAIARDRVVWAVRSWIIQYGQDLNGMARESSTGSWGELIS